MSITLCNFLNIYYMLTLALTSLMIIILYSQNFSLNSRFIKHYTRWYLLLDCLLDGGWSGRLYSTSNFL